MDDWFVLSRPFLFTLPIQKFLTSGPGIYHGTLNLNVDSEDHIDAAALLTYPSIPGNDFSEIPISMSLTEFHFILLYKNRIAGICNLDDKLTYEEVLPIVSYLFMHDVSTQNESSRKQMKLFWGSRLILCAGHIGSTQISRCSN